MTETSTRFNFPFIVPGQAQKEMSHNEAIVLIDAVLHPTVEGAPVDVPPEVPELGQAWLLGEAPQDAWEGYARSLACWTIGGWRFVAPQEGMCVWNRADQLWLRWTGSQWSHGQLEGSELRIGGQKVVGARLPEVPNPSGGTTIDAEARQAITAITATLKSHGLTD